MANTAQRILTDLPVLYPKTPDKSTHERACARRSPPGRERYGPSLPPLHSANGIMFDGQDRMHTAGVVGRGIAVMDTESGAIYITGDIANVIHRIGPLP